MFNGALLKETQLYKACTLLITRKKESIDKISAKLIAGPMARPLYGTTY